MKTSKVLKKISTMFVAVSLVVTVATSTASAAFVGRSSTMFDAGTVDMLDIVPVTEDWSEGFRAYLTNLVTGEREDVTSQVTFGTNGAQTQTKLTLTLNSSQYNVAHYFELYDADGMPVTATKVCIMKGYKVQILENVFSGETTFVDQYLQDINLQKNTIRIVPVTSGEDANVALSVGGAPVSGSGGGTALLLNGTSIPYIAGNDAKAVYTVENVPAGEYTIYYLFNGAAGYYGKTDVGFAVNNGTPTNIANITTPQMKAVGKFNFTEGTNTITVSKATSSNTDRLFVADMWLVPTNYEKKAYADLDIGALFCTNNTTPITDLNAVKTVFKAQVYWTAYGNGQTGAEPVKIICAHYGSDGTLKNIDMKDFSMTKTPTLTASKRITYQSYAQDINFSSTIGCNFAVGDYVKLFTWDAVNGMTPVRTAQTISCTAKE